MCYLSIYLDGICIPHRSVEDPIWSPLGAFPPRVVVAQVDARAHNKQTPLMWAMTRGHVQVVPGGFP